LTQPSRRFDLWRRLYTRFTIEPLPAQLTESPGISTTIQPTTDADLLLAVIIVVESGALDLTAAAGTFVPGMTVPTGKRWRVSFIYKQSSIANGQVMLQVDGTLIQFTPVSTDEETHLTNLGLHLEEDDIIGLVTTGNAGDGSRQVKAVVLEEDAF